MGFSPNRRQGTEGFIHLPKVFLDIETTGSSLEEGGEICEAGLVKLDPQTLTVIDELDLKFAVTNPLQRTEEQLSFGGYNGFTFDGWQDAIPAAAALRQLNAFVVDCSPWAYNVVFEYQWLSQYYDVEHIDWAGDYHWFDLMTVAMMKLEPDFRSGRITKLSLSSVGAYLGLGEEAKPHRGLAGARYEIEVYKRLLEFSPTT